MYKTNKKRVRESIEVQLKLQGKDQAFYLNLIDDYMRFLDLKEDMFDDIKKRGLTVETTNGNGIRVEKPNDSAINVIKVSSQMLKILSDLDIKDVILEDEDNENDYM